MTITPASQHYPLFSGFIQDEIALVPKMLSLTAGGKTEQNRFTGFDFQPSLRLNWRPIKNAAVWTSVSKAMKIPNILNTSMNRMLNASQGPDGVDATTLVGNPKYKDEHLLAYEAGYRLQFKRASIDATGFVNNYNDVETNESVAPGGPRGIHRVSGAMGKQPVWQKLRRRICDKVERDFCWRMTASYSWLKLEMRANSQSNDTSTAVGFNTGTPANHFAVRSSYSLKKNLDFNMLAQYTGPLPSGLGGQSAPALPIVLLRADQLPMGRRRVRSHGYWWTRPALSAQGAIRRRRFRHPDPDHPQHLCKDRVCFLEAGC